VRQARSGRTRSWTAPVVGEQVSVFSPSGETGAGVILRGFNCDSFPPPSDNPDLDILFLGDDGHQDSYDLAQHIRQIAIPAAGKLVITVGDATVTVSNESAVVTLGSSTLTIQDGAIAVQANAVQLAGGGQAVARVGDQVDLNTGKIITGSAKVTAG
jgi:phage baseplate assembly protein V